METFWGDDAVLQEGVDDDTLAVDDAEEINHFFRVHSNEIPHDVSLVSTVGVEQGKIDVGIAVGGVKETDSSGYLTFAPKTQNVVHAEEMIQEGAVFVPTPMTASFFNFGGAWDPRLRNPRPRGVRLCSFAR